MVLGALATATMLANLETSIIATALPKIVGDFNSFESFAWVGTSYIVTSAIATPLLGKLSDLAWTAGSGANRIAAWSSYVSATGGNVTNYTIGGISYRAHIFTNSGTLTVTAGGSVEYLIVGGGACAPGSTDYRVGGGGGGDDAAPRR